MDRESGPGSNHRAEGGSAGGRVLVVDDDQRVRGAIAELLSAAGYPTREAEGGEKALQAAREERPWLVVSEVCLPDISGYTVCRQLRDEFGDDLPIVLVSERRTESFDRMAGFLVGADEYMSKPFASDEFLFRVRRLLRSSSPPAPAVALTLTAREIEILGLLAQGLGQKEIAKDLYISPKTVNTHIERIYKKLGVRRRAQAVAVAFRAGLVDAS